MSEIESKFITFVKTLKTWLIDNPHSSIFLAGFIFGLIIRSLF